MAELATNDAAPLCEDSCVPHGNTSVETPDNVVALTFATSVDPAPSTAPPEIPTANAPHLTSPHPEIPLSNAPNVLAEEAPVIVPLADLSPQRNQFLDYRW